MKRLVAGDPERHRSNVWGTPRAPFAPGSEAAPTRSRPVPRPSPHRRHGSPRIVTTGRSEPCCRTSAGCDGTSVLLRTRPDALGDDLRPAWPDEDFPGSVPRWRDVRGDEDHTDSGRIRPESGTDPAAGTGAPRGATERSAGPTSSPSRPPRRRTRPGAASSSSPDVPTRDRPRDDEALDLAGALEDGVDLGVAVHPLHRVLPAVARAPEDLDRLLRCRDREFAGPQL